MQPIFQNISDGGITWLFVVLANNDWEIRRDGEKIACGGSDHKSVDEGIRQYLLLTAAGSPSAQIVPANL